MLSSGKTRRAIRRSRGNGHGGRRHRHRQAHQEGRSRRPSRRRVESRLCGLRDRDDGVLPFDVADQHDHPRTEARHRRLLRRAKHFANLERFRRRARRQGHWQGRCARRRPGFGRGQEHAVFAFDLDRYAQGRQQARRIDGCARHRAGFASRERRSPRTVDAFDPARPVRQRSRIDPAGACKACPTSPNCRGR